MIESIDELTSNKLLKEKSNNNNKNIDFSNTKDQ